MKKIILLSYLFFVFITNLYSQEVVVSEIYIASGANTEWTELLVVQDNISLVGYSIRDNGSEGLWMGGIRFKDVDLWRNLRAGTIIIINHRGGVIDDNKSDGYLEVGALSSYYFDTFLPDGTPGPLDVSESISSLNFNTSHDMIQIRNNRDEHVHCLGFIGNGNYSVYDALPATKAFHNQGVSQNVSIKIAPGAILSSYNCGISSLEVTNTGIVTKGLPNKRNTNDYINQLFWRELRQPVWTNPGVISTNIINNYKWVELKWNAASTYSDLDEGYMIVRYVDNNNYPLILEDGKIYNVGQQIGFYKVIGYVQSLTKTEFIDKFEDGTNFECGRYYGYQVYAYRYKQSDIDPNTYDFQDSRNARGRQYNEVSFASVSKAIRKEIPPVSNISTNIGVLKFCSNVDAKIISDIKDKSKYNYEWYSSIEGLIPINDTIISISKAGDYWLKLVDKLSGCYSESNILKIEILESPQAYIINSSDNKTFTKDTLVQVCVGNTLNLKGLSLPSGSNITTHWTKNNSFFSDKNDISINDDGVYKFISIAGGLCPDTSVTITVRFISPDFYYDKTNFVFDADSSPTQDIIVTNNSNTELIINLSDIAITPANNFKIISPTNFPVTIQPKGNFTFTIKFDIIGYGERNGKFIINSYCNYSKTANLTGSRQNIGTTRLDVDIKEIDFGIIANKCNIISDTTVKVVSTGSENTLLYKPRFSTNAFEIVSNLFSTPEQRTSVIASSNIEFGIRVASSQPGVYIDTLVAPYILQGKTDTIGYISIALKAEIYDPSIELVTKILDFSDIVSCKKSIDTFFIVKNPSITDITIQDKFDISGNAQFLNSLPRIIKSNSTDTIKLRLDFNADWNAGLIFNYYNPCLLESNPLQIIPPTKKLDISFEQDTLDFGTINNCKNSDDIIKSAILKASNIGASIGKIIYNSTHFKSDLYENKILNMGDNSFGITLPNYASGKIIDSLVFLVEPCNEMYVLYLKANRINPSAPKLSSTTIDFGTDFIYNAETKILTISNENEEFPLTIDSLVLPLPFELISHTKADFPIIIPALSYIDFEFEFKRANSGLYDENAKIYSSEPCKYTIDFTIKGESIDNRTAKFKASLPNYENIELGKEKFLPINIEFDANYDIKDIDVRRMTFYISFDYVTMNLRTANISQNIKSANPNLIFDDSQDGRLILTLNIINSNNLQEGEFINLTAKPLLGDNLKSFVKLDSVIILSKLPSVVETNETEVDIVGECELDSRLLTVKGQFGIYVNNDYSNNHIDINFSTISNENTKISLFDMNGNFVKNIVNSSLLPGNYTTKLDISSYASGIYILVLNNGIRTKSISFPIIK